MRQMCAKRWPDHRLTWQRACLGPLMCLVVWLAGCAAPPKPVPPAPPVLPPTVQPAPPEPVAPSEPEPAPAPAVIVAPEPEVVEVPPPLLSAASNPRDYRKDAGKHLYQKYADRVYIGKMPPMLQAVGVLELDIGKRGEVLALRWTRPPRQVPQVMAEIESMVRAAAPFPAPVRMGPISYTEVWLWHKSGRFQLDSLTEGQK
jgi:periplasmic protein TonB